ncbi:MAG TPA: GNAT family N-acetyltransferase [Ktedonobacteraceae bacterium]|nr:GNAT family N-acetyltransferase [Ktedonobacteraceae bacterium]
MPWTPCRIRYATLHDARSISSIYQQSTQSAYQDVMPEAPIYARLLNRLEPFWEQKLALPPAKEQRLLVAEYEGQVVGFVEVGTATYPEEVAIEDTGELHFLFVAPDFMGGGIGYRLLARATELLHEDGYRKAILWVFSRNLQARRFYESQGWSTNGVERPDPALSFLATPPLEVCYTLTLR